MKRHDQPIPDTPAPVDRAQVHALVAELHAAADAGESIHGAPAVYALDDLCGSCMAGYYVTAMLAHPVAPPSVDTMVDHILKGAPRWAEDAARLRGRG